MTTEQMDWLDDELSGRHAAVNPPSRELDSDVVNGGRTVPNAAKRVKERAKAQAKADKKRKKMEKAMRDAEFTPAQRLMRDEMSSPIVRGDRDLKPFSQLGAVLDEAFGPLRSDKERATEVAFEVINEYQGQIVTGFKEWATIQGMVEDAYLRGLAEGMVVGESNDDLVPGPVPRFNQPRADD